MTIRLLVMSIFGVVAFASAANAGILYVETNGIDSSTCGTRRSPCRSISRAIENASELDVILVGPGRYGDADGDGDFRDAGDESSEEGFGCYCVLNISKHLTVVSAQGAEMTVINSPSGHVDQVVEITASGATFGASGHGFSISGGPHGITVVAASEVTVAGNHVIAANGRGIRVEGARHRIAQNIVSGPMGVSVIGTDSEIVGNSVGSSNLGVDLGGSGHVVEGNAIVGSPGIGVQIGSAATVVRGNAILGNQFRGIVILAGGAGATITENNIYGNGCGVENGSNSSVDARNNFWGSPLGPGPDPADQICDLAGSATLFDPPAPTAFRVRVQIAR